MSITIFVQNKCKNRLLTATVTSSSTSKMTKSVVKCIIQVQTRDLIVRITSNFGSITLHTKLIDSWKTAHQILFLTTAVIVYLKMDEFVLKCASRDQIPHITGILHGNITSPLCSNGITQISFRWFFIDIGVGIVSKYIF